jgi:3-methylcrotonyl-CoA carboxylase alpha subunit
MKLACGDETSEVRLEGEGAVLDGRPVAFSAVRAGGRLEAIRIGRDVIPVRAVRDGNRVLVWCAGVVLELRQARGRASRAGEASGDLLAPMPGRVRRVVLGAGTKVERGDVILILEAMKMEHAIRAPREGTLERVFFGEGDLVEAGMVLAELGD